MSGYLHFSKTGDAAVDAILDLLNEAGSAFHHTENWGDEYHGEPTYCARIQAAANAAAESAREERGECIAEGIVSLGDNTLVNDAGRIVVVLPMHWKIPQALDAVCKGTLGEGKSANGAEAPKWYQDGQLSRVISYCLDDVRLERDLAIYVDNHAHVRHESGGVLQIPVQAGR